VITLAMALSRIGPVTDETAVRDLIERSTATLGRELLYYLGPPLERVQLINGGCQAVELEDEPTADTTLAVETRDDIFSTFEVLDELDDDGEPNYALDGRHLVHRTFWPAGRKTVRVTYTAGFDEGTGPQHFQNLVLEMVVEGWQAAQAAAAVSAGIKSEEIGDYKYTNFTAAELEAAASRLGTSWEAFVKRWKRHLI